MSRPSSPAGRCSGLSHLGGGVEKLSLRGLLESQNKEAAKAKMEPSCTNTKGSFRWTLSTPYHSLPSPAGCASSPCPSPCCLGAWRLVPCSGKYRGQAWILLGLCIPGCFVSLWKATSFSRFSFSCLQIGYRLLLHHRVASQFLRFKKRAGSPRPTGTASCCELFLGRLSEN